MDLFKEEKSRDGEKALSQMQRIIARPEYWPADLVRQVGEVYRNIYRHMREEVWNG